MTENRNSSEWGTNLKKIECALYITFKDITTFFISFNISWISIDELHFLISLNYWKFENSYKYFQGFTFFSFFFFFFFFFFFQKNFFFLFCVPHPKLVSFPFLFLHPFDLSFILILISSIHQSISLLYWFIFTFIALISLIFICFFEIFLLAVSFQEFIKFLEQFTIQHRENNQSFANTAEIVFYDRSLIVALKYLYYFSSYTLYFLTFILSFLQKLTNILLIQHLSPKWC